jgi:hypothetical protein
VPEVIVSFAERNASDGDTTVYIGHSCSLCGALVVNRDRPTHLRWHDSVQTYSEPREYFCDDVYDRHIDRDTVEKKPYEPLGERFARDWGLIPKGESPRA